MRSRSPRTRPEESGGSQAAKTDSLASQRKHSVTLEKAGGPFAAVATWAARAAGGPVAFSLAAVAIVVWLAVGPLCHFSDTWQLAINTSTTIITFLMVFVIQNTQNRDSRAVQIKLDELIRSSKAHNMLLGLEDLSQEELDHLKQNYARLAKEARDEFRRGLSDTGSPGVELE
jgi:low affinity Fe/Cu permease